ncbi:integrin beta-1-like isoform X2 [Hyposmocoma kahamanoa]|uniref:integrin beta-1-like isoform X2 n=1 Tax=Hyposmocoma kahamanoa TaxID=1477025 RepID=UPI000E6D908E|nr:integrin beta-1-like isoform X2 [Hyposmocoma kahamanoa]
MLQIVLQKDHKGSRCQSRTFKDGNNEWCKEFQDPFSTFDPTVKNYELSSSTENPVQLRPQKVSFKARPGESRKFKLYYKPAKNYPLDVYFLMDNSYTMRFHMTTLFNEAKMIYQSLTKLTNNVRFGVGSFIEKHAFPFANPSPDTHKAYAFRNDLPMSNNIDKFVETIKTINETYSSGNYDSQEATLDALMQAMVCKEINWRKSWKLIVVSTDAPYHSAGDGKLVGAYKPNDMKCHLTNNTYKTDQSLLYDYPSVSQINKVAKENEIAILFAVLKKVKNTYEILGTNIDNARIVELKNTAEEKSEIVDTIQTQYKNLTEELMMTSTSVPSFINVELDPPCRVKKDNCKIMYEKPFGINVTLTMNSCPDDNFEGTMEIGPALLKAKVEVDVEILCKCDCERHGEANSSECSGNGTYQCGVCYCNTNSYGEKCQCTGSSSEEEDIEKCKANKGDTQVCSGRALCNCGECQDCPSDYMGAYCEIAKYHCPAPHEKMCGGHGTCLANSTCDCHPGWIGSACTCSTNKDPCTGPYNTFPLVVLWLSYCLSVSLPWSRGRYWSICMTNANTESLPKRPLQMGLTWQKTQSTDRPQLTLIIPHTVVELRIKLILGRLQKSHHLLINLRGKG